MDNTPSIKVKVVDDNKFKVKETKIKVPKQLSKKSQKLIATDTQDYNIFMNYSYPELVKKTRDDNNLIELIKKEFGRDNKENLSSVVMPPKEEIKKIENDLFDVDTTQEEQAKAEAIKKLQGAVRRKEIQPIYQEGVKFQRAKTDIEEEIKSIMEEVGDIEKSTKKEKEFEKDLYTKAKEEIEREIRNLNNQKSKTQKSLNRAKTEKTREDKRVKLADINMKLEKLKNERNMEIKPYIQKLGVEVRGKGRPKKSK